MIDDLHFPSLQKWNIQGHSLRLKVMKRSRTATSVKYEIPLYVDQRLEPTLQRRGGGDKVGDILWGDEKTVLVPPCLFSTPPSHPRIQVLCCARSKHSVCKKKFLRTTLKTQQTQGLSDLPKQLLKRKRKTKVSHDSIGRILFSPCMVAVIHTWKKQQVGWMTHHWWPTWKTSCYLIPINNWRFISSPDLLTFLQKL